jgi:hypothetical protein
MSLFTTLSPLLLAAAAAPAEPACAPIAGWEQVLADDAVRFMILGEMHGSNEMPAIFADAVCLTAQARPVVVALEQSSADQAAIDAFMASDGRAEAKRTFLGARMWNGPMKDGRSSEAYFRLFDTLRQMQQAGRISAVVAFEPFRFDKLPTPTEYEKAMADLVRAAGQSGATVLALVGNIHAMRTEVQWQGGYMPMAGHLPPAATVTLNLVADGGESWNCQGGPDSCRANASPGPPRPNERGVQLGAGDDGPFSGVLYLGSPTTASPPQAGPPG